MVKINLEKSLIKANKKLVMPKELLIINEYDKFSNFNLMTKITFIALFVTTLLCICYSCKKQDNVKLNSENKIFMPLGGGDCDGCLIKK